MLDHQREQDLAEAGQSAGPGPAPRVRHSPHLPPQVQHQELRDCLTKHTILIRGEFVTRPLNIVQAADRRDAFVKVQSCDGRAHMAICGPWLCSLLWRWRAGQSRGPWAGPHSASHLPGDHGLLSLSGPGFLPLKEG